MIGKPEEQMAKILGDMCKEKHSEGPKLDRDWWRAQGIEYCMDRMELMAAQLIAPVKESK